MPGQASADAEDLPSRREIEGFDCLVVSTLGRNSGAITPEDGFKYAFQNGADFICVGMYDFQIVDDVNILLAVLNGDLKRERPWRAWEEWEEDVLYTASQI
jgi:hypothetical protein